MTSKIEAKIKVKNNALVSKTIKVKKIENSLIAGSLNTFCFSGNCFSSSTYVSPLSVILSSGATDSSFAGDYSPKGFLGTSTITYVFFDINNVNDSAWVVVNFVATPAGLIENTAIKFDISNPYPNPAKNMVIYNYSFTGEINDAKILVRDLLGNIVIQEQIFDLQGKLSIDISDLKNGIYFYSFVLNNKNVVSKKLVIQH